MRLCVVLSALLGLLVAGPVAVSAASGEPALEDEFELKEAYEPSAGAVFGAIAINLVYVPVRFAVTVFGAALGGIEGLISAGDGEAANDIWALTDGSQVVTPGMLEGREPWTFSGYGW